MKHYTHAVLIVGMAVIALAGAFWLYGLRHQSTKTLATLPQVSPDAATLSTNTTTSAVQAIGATTPSSTSSTSVGNAAGWATLTNPEDSYRIQYPTTFGDVYVSFGGPARETILDIGGYEADISFLNDPKGLTLEQWLDQEAKSGQATARTQSVSINGLHGIIVPTPGEDGTVGAYIYTVINGASVIYELSFSCDGYCLPPPFWQQMLNSFQALPADGQTLIR